MRIKRTSLTILVGSLVFPPAGLVLLWWRGSARVWKKCFASLAIVAIGVAQLFLIYGMRVEFAGNIQPRFSFGSAERQYEAIEKHRAAQVATAAAPPGPRGTEAGRPGNAAAQPQGATYWTDFRGPGRLGIYGAGPILTDWPAGGLEMLWKQPSGGGYASFAVANGVAFTIEQRRGNEVVAAYDIHNGRERWTNAWKGRFEETLGGVGPRATPVWDEGRVYALGAEGEFRCLDAATGAVIWRKNILSENGAANLTWGMAGSPLLVEGLAIVAPGGPNGHSVAAYDKLSGKAVWSSLSDESAYASPMLATLAGQRQIVIVMARRAVGLTVEEGRLLWEYPWVTQQGINCAQPIVVGPNRIYFSSGYGRGAAVIELTPQGDAFETRTVWANNRMRNKFNSAVLYNGYIYGLDEGILACVDAETGELKWKGGRYGYGQLLLASGRLMILTEDGDVVLALASPEKLRETARFSALKGKTWNIPAISDGLLLVRNESQMAAFRIAPNL